MPNLLLDKMDDAILWNTNSEDGISISSSVSVSNDSAIFCFGSDRTSLRIVASVNSFHHFITRTFNDIDCCSFDEIRFWVYGNRTANSSKEKPAYLEIKFGSGITSPDAVTNTWTRYIQVAKVNRWELQRIDIRDLPVSIRSSLRTMRLQVIDVLEPIDIHIDNLLAVRDEPLGDCDNALLEILNNKVTLPGGMVPALIMHPENTETLTIPQIRLTNYDIQYVPERTQPTKRIGDFKSTGPSLLPDYVAYDIFYAIDIYATTRHEKSIIIEYVLGTLAPRSVLIVNGIPYPIEIVTIDPFDATGKWRSDRQLLYFKVMTRQEVGTMQGSTVPFNSVTMMVDQN